MEETHIFKFRVEKFCEGSVFMEAMAELSHKTKES